MNLPNDIRFGLLVRYVAELTSLEENLLVEKAIALDPEIGCTIENIHNHLIKIAAQHEKVPKQSLKYKILQIIGNWENNKASLITNFCQN